GEGEGWAIVALSALGIWLGGGIACRAAGLAPAVVAIGGGVADADDLLLGPARRAFLAQLTGRGHRPMLDIRKATLGNDAGLIGAADLARK
ncbi:ROK family protein, partial [Nocardioides sp. NPDC057772]|uniref:ROK family protein n=1 Tax=Nocardioides sp. NPDC057772 TaxID=3346245 RepID=UPI0036705679